jgi:sugar phosphate isomerase/epimerase
VIFVSTGGYRHQTAVKTALDFYSKGISHVELSGGLHSTLLNDELKMVPNDLVLQVHNYFPPPPLPFVFNLASNNPNVFIQSMEHARSAIKIAATLERSLYSFHAGFRIDPSATELGGNLLTHKLTDRFYAIDLFIDAVTVLSKEAEILGVKLLIENNVITKFNLNRFGEDPLLMTQPNEIISVMERLPRNVGLLLDVAHLKVSAQSLQFDLISGHQALKPWICGYHLSDNNGIVDSNQPVKFSSWFWPHLVQDLDFYTLEVYGVSIEDLYFQQCLTGEMLYKKL